MHNFKAVYDSINLKKLHKDLLKIMFFVFLLFIIVGQLPANGTVLCLGSDGHIEIEKVSKDLKCTKPLEIQTKPVNTLSFLNKLSDFKHCGSCLDIHLSNTNIESKIFSTIDPVINLKQLSSFFITIIFPQNKYVKSEQTNYVLNIKQFKNSHLPQMEKVVIIC